MTTDNSRWSRWSEAMENAKEKLRGLGRGGTAFREPFPSVQFFESWAGLDEYPDDLRQHMAKLLPTLRYLDAYSARSLDRLEVRVDLSIVWSVLQTALEEAISIDNKSGNGWREEDGQPIRALEDVRAILEDFGLKVERFQSYQATQSRTSPLTKQRTINVHIWFLEIVTSACACLLKYDDWKDVLAENKRRSESIDKLLNHLGSLGHNQGAEPLEGGARQNEDMGAKLPYDNIPGRLNPNFFGRDKELEAISTYLAPDRNRPAVKAVAVNGLGGVGKSQVALHYAHRQIENKLVDLVLWVHAGTPEAISQDINAVTLGLQLSGARPEASSHNQVLLSNWLKTTPARWLIVFDNVVSPTLLKDAWPAGIGTVLVTARSETVGSQLGCKLMEIHIFDMDIATTIFLRLLDRSESGLNSDDERAAVTELVEKLNGHALAIHQMVALIKLRKYNVRKFLGLYQTRAKELHRAHQRIGLVDTPYFLDKVWEFSFETLKDEGSASCTLLGVLCFLMPESIPRELFRGEKGVGRGLALSDRLAFCQDELEFDGAEEELLSLALVRKDSNSEALTIHRLVQSEFRYNVDQDDVQNFFNAAAELLFRAFPQQVKGRVMHAVWGTCSKYLQHVLSLARHFDRPEKGIGPFTPTAYFCKLICSCAWYLSETQSDQLSGVLDIAFKAYKQCDASSQDPIDYAHMCNTQGVYYMDRGLFRKAEVYLTECKTIREANMAQDDEELGNIFNNLGNLLYSRLQYDKAVQSHHRAEAIRNKLGNDDMYINSKGMTQLNLGRSYWRLGNKAEAWNRLEEAQKAFKSSKNWYLLAHSYLLLGTFEREEGEYEEAKELYEKGLYQMIQVGKMSTHPTTSTLLYKLGCVAYDKKDYETATKKLKEAMSLAKSVEDTKGHRARVAHMLGEALRQKDGLTEEAKEMLNEAIVLRRELESQDDREDSGEDQSEQAYDNLVCGNSR